MSSQVNHKPTLKAIPRFEWNNELPVDLWPRVKKGLNSHVRLKMYRLSVAHRKSLKRPEWETSITDWHWIDIFGSYFLSTVCTNLKYLPTILISICNLIRNSLYLFCWLLTSLDGYLIYVILSWWRLPCIPTIVLYAYLIWLGLHWIFIIIKETVYLHCLRLHHVLILLYFIQLTANWDSITEV